ILMSTVVAGSVKAGVLTGSVEGNHSQRWRVNGSATGAHPQRWRANRAAAGAPPQRWRVSAAAGRGGPERSPWCGSRWWAYP
ncbi:hypothetical protein ELK10_35500, partial [Klebsiella pneumoniae]|nr:hypothetical protein [Klebsiella pneumoniae]